MSTRNRTPPLLEPYLGLPPEASQLLLTGVLDASPQWLVTRLLRSCLHPSDTTSSIAEQEGEEGSEKDNVSVILVSWMRDWEFWKSEARRGAGLDLTRLAQQKRFVFVDGLTQLFPVPATQSAATPSTPQRSLPVRNTPASPIPSRGGPLPSRGPPGNIPARNPPTTQPQPQASPQPTPLQHPPNSTPLKDPSLATLESTITAAKSSLHTTHPTSKIHLILDSPTLLLATSASPSATSLSSLLLSLRSNIHSTTLVLETDSPFLDAARDFAETRPAPTPLEAAHAAFVAQQAHVSYLVAGCRPLDTGKARDVSGVLRLSRGGAWDEVVGDGVDGEIAGAARELEALYFVQVDGGVSVFNRGEASVG